MGDKAAKRAALAECQALAGLPPTPDRTPCSWWRPTGRMTPFVDGISSPIMALLGGVDEVSQRDLPVGALFCVPADCHYPAGADGKAVVCILPGGHHWYIDGRASNCTKPEDEAHRCWVRHGTEGEALTVDKNGLTCSAGGGSIRTSDYHGFLRGGALVKS